MVSWVVDWSLESGSRMLTSAGVWLDSGRCCNRIARLHSQQIHAGRLEGSHKGAPSHEGGIITIYVQL